MWKWFSCTPVTSMVKSSTKGPGEPGAVEQTEVAYRGRREEEREGRTGEWMSALRSCLRDKKNNSLPTSLPPSLSPSYLEKSTHAPTKATTPATTSYPASESTNSPTSE